jgi:hypothetical protein
MIRPVVRALAVVAAVSAIAPRAFAQEEPEALIRQGNEMRRRGEDLKAHGYFKRAYDVAHTPRTAAQLGLAEQAIGSFADAEQHLSEALASGDPWVGHNRSVLEQSRSAARAHLGSVEVRGAPPGTEVALEGRAKAPLPADGVLWLAPGPATVRFTAAGYEGQTMHLSAEVGRSVALDVRLAETEHAARPAPAPVPAIAPAPTPVAIAATPVPDSDGRRALRITGAAAAGTGLAIAAAGFFVYRQGSSKVDAINHDAAANGGAGVPYNEANGNYQTLGTTGVALMIGGGALAVAGAVLYLVDRERGDAGVSVGYLPGPGGGLWLGGRY